MKIGFITADLSHTHGWAHYSLEIPVALHRQGLDLKIVASTNSDLSAVPEDLPVYPILPTLVPRARGLLPRLMRYLPQVRRLLADRDLIHVTVEPFAPLGAWSAGARPFVQGGVGSYLNIDAWQRPPALWLYRRAFERSHIVCISHYSQRVAQQVFPGVPTSTIALGIDPTRLASEPPPLHTAISGPVVLSVGGIKPRKGTLHLVQAMAQVREAIPEAHCVILGNPRDSSDYTVQVRAEISRLNLADCVHILGFVDEPTLRAWYARADLFALPSMNQGWDFEGFGLVHMEASAAGLPVIGTRDCGVEDAVQEGITGLLVSQTRIDEKLPQAMITLLSDPQRAQRMGNAGRAWAQARTWDRVAEEMTALYTRIHQKG